MKVILAKNYGFCFGVKRAIEMAENHKDSVTLGPLIHNPKEIQRLEANYNVRVANGLEELDGERNVIIRTHGIEKDDYQRLQERNLQIINATCPFVTKPQEIVERISSIRRSKVSAVTP